MEVKGEKERVKGKKEKVKGKKEKVKGGKKEKVKRLFGLRGEEYLVGVIL